MSENETEILDLIDERPKSIASTIETFGKIFLEAINEEECFDVKQKKLSLTTKGKGVKLLLVAIKD